MNTREKITDITVELCNRHGAFSVTTNHIIDELGISPGTLYYHFKNKEEIIREIFLKISSEFTQVMSGFDKCEDFSGTMKLFRENYRLIYKYRFFYLEISSLLKKDEILKEMYRKNYREKMKFMKSAIIHFEKKGLIKKFSSSDQIERLMKNIWIITDFWMSFSDSSGENTNEKMIDGGLKQLEEILKPHMIE